MQMAVKERKGTMSAPADLATNLALEPSCSGILMKSAEFSMVDDWKSWHFELRGVYLFSFKDEATARAAAADTNSPLGAIDLRQLTSAASLNTELILSSRTREIRFRADHTLKIPSSTTLDSWARCITSVLESKVENDADVRESSSDLEIALSDTFEAPLTRTAQVENPLNLGLAIDNTHVSTYTSKIPKRFRMMCILCGLMRGGQNRISNMYLWAARFLVMFLLLIYIFNMVSATAFGVTYSKNVLALPEGVDKSCSRSFVPDRDGDEIPCLLTAAYFVLAFATGFTGLFLYSHLMKNIEKDLATFFRDDTEEKLIEDVEKLSSIFMSLMFFVLVPAGTIYTCFAVFSTSDLASSPLLAIVFGLVFCIIVTMCSIAILPGFIYSILFYVETRQLGNLLSKFLTRLHQRPFKYSEVGPRYLEIIYGCKTLQRRVGLPSSVCFGGWLASLTACYIVVAYALWFQNSTTITITTLYYMAAVTIEFLPPFMLLVYGTIRVNDMMDPIANICYTIMASPTYDGSKVVNYSTTSEDSNIARCAVEDGTFAEETTGAMKLALLVEKVPCTMLLLGWKISWSGILTSIAAVLVTQALGAVGLGGG